MEDSAVLDDVRAGFFVGLAGASPVLAHRVDSWAYFFLIISVSAYEAGSFLVGSGAPAIKSRGHSPESP